MTAPTKALFDPFEHLLSRQAYEAIKKGWRGVFRHVILEFLPVEAAAAGHFNPVLGPKGRLAVEG